MTRERQRRRVGEISRSGKKPRERAGRFSELLENYFSVQKQPISRNVIHFCSHCVWTWFCVLPKVSVSRVNFANTNRLAMFAVVRRGGASAARCQARAALAQSSRKKSRMSLVPSFFEDRSNRWPTFFGSGVFRDLDREFRDMIETTNRLQRALEERMMGSGESATFVKNQSDKFEVALDVTGFEPNELKVRVQDRVVTIEGKHEEKEDEHGFISRQFCRRYVVPEGVQVENVTSRISSDGILTVSAPKLTSNESKDVKVEIEKGSSDKQAKAAINEK
ncbi:unnamed protein product [Cyprideis torosa]|uniref:Uncharacterized protein n=1 Tax=Cyprideis torosa TaxID=163714 RepID=A0A7R8WG26_9CRUS|nr:unnamed protein product [Cyprideis torosa]CAG0891613.1 unnamed protein product [Cyprideis torosa]